MNGYDFRSKTFTNALLVAAILSVGFCTSTGEITRQKFPSLAGIVPGTIYVFDGLPHNREGTPNAVTFSEDGTIKNLEAMGLGDSYDKHWEPIDDSRIRIVLSNGYVAVTLDFSSNKDNYRGRYKSYLPPLRVMFLNEHAKIHYEKTGGLGYLLWSNDPTSPAWLTKQKANERAQEQREAEELKASLRGTLSSVLDLGPINYCLDGTTNCPDTEEFETFLLAHFNSKQNPDLFGRIDLQRRMDEFEWETYKTKKLAPALQSQQVLLSFRPTLTYDFQSKALNVSFTHTVKVGAAALGLVGGVQVPLMQMESFAIQMSPEKAKALKATGPLFSMSAKVTVAPQEISYFECVADGERIPVTAGQKSDFEREGAFCSPAMKRSKVIRLSPIRYALCAGKECVRGP